MTAPIPRATKEIGPSVRYNVWPPVADASLRRTLSGFFTNKLISVYGV